jgi:hypothetical protein
VNETTVEDAKYRNKDEANMITLNANLLTLFLIIYSKFSNENRDKMLLFDSQMGNSSSPASVARVSMNCRRNDRSNSSLVLLFRRYPLAPIRDPIQFTMHASYVTNDRSSRVSAKGPKHELSLDRDTSSVLMDDLAV